MTAHNPRDWEGVFCGLNDYEGCAYSELNGECHQVNCPYQTSEKPESSFKHRKRLT